MPDINGQHRHGWLQTSAEADAKQADMRSKHLQKQLIEQQKSLQSVEKEAAKLQKDLAKEEAAVQACQQRCSCYVCSLVVLFDPFPFVFLVGPFQFFYFAFFPQTLKRKV